MRIVRLLAGFDRIMAIGESGFDRILATEEAGFDGILATEEAGFDGILATGEAGFDGILATGEAGFDGILATEEAGFDGILAIENFKKKAKFPVLACLFVKHSCRYIHRLHKSLANSVLSLSRGRSVCLLSLVDFVSFFRFSCFLLQVIWPFLLACLPACLPAFLPSFLPFGGQFLFSAGVAICQSSSFNLLLCSSSSQFFLFSQGLRQLGIRSDHHFGGGR